MFLDFEDRGFMLIALLGGGASPEDATSVAEQYGVTYPIVADLSGVGEAFERDGAIPSHTLLTTGAEIVVVDERCYDEDVEAVLP